jgi:DNA-binding NarL/FixJ family response regulator
MDGIETTRLIKAQLPDVSVIGLSLFADEPYNNLMREAGAEAFTSKSGSSAELLEAIYGISRNGRSVDKT